MPFRNLSKFFVEVRTKTPHGEIIKSEPVDSWPAACSLAQKMAHQMFYEDPRTLKVCVNGVFSYENKNDMGDPVLIRPMAGINHGITIPEAGACGFAGMEDDGHEPA